MLVSIIAVLAAVVWAAVATPTKAPLEHRSSPLDTITDLYSRQTGTLPSKFSWSSSDALVWPKDDGRNIAGIKDPSIVFYNSAYHVFASTAQASGYNLVSLHRLRQGQQLDLPLPGPDPDRHGLPCCARGLLLRAAEAVVPRLPERKRRLLDQRRHSKPSGMVGPDKLLPGRRARDHLR